MYPVGNVSWRCLDSIEPIQVILIIMHTPIAPIVVRAGLGKTARPKRREGIAMPRTASTRSIDSDRLRSRPVTPRSARHGASGAEIAAELPPILFRLPALASSPLDAKRLAPEEDQASLARGAQATSMRDVPESATEATCVADCSAGTAHAPQIILETFGGLPNSVSENAPATEVAPASAAPVAAAPVAVVSTALERTWWEHWSSGVVLILLIIALITASIIALNDGGTAKSNDLASQAELSMGDEFDLSSITIPEITIPSDSSHNNNGITAAPLGAIPQVAATAVAPVDFSVVASADRADEALELTTTREPADVAPAALGPQATLDQPIGIAAPQLFANGVLPSNAAQRNTGLAVPSITASNPTVSLELPSAVPPADAAKSAMDGSSPTFYDGASRIMEQHAASGNAVGQAWPIETESANMPSEGFVHSAEGPIDTNLPSFQTILASASGEAKGVGAAPKPSFSTASHTQPASPSAALGVSKSGATSTSQYTSSAPTATVVPSATPDFSGNSLVSEYFKYEQMRQAAEATAENRYPSSTTIAPQPNAVSQSAASQSLGSGTGLTLGSPQPGTPVAPPLPR